MDQAAVSPHVLIFPFPLQGHVNSMLKLAELFCLGGLQVTFLISSQTHTRLFRYTNVQSRFSSYPAFQFKTLPNSLDEDGSSNQDTFIRLYDSLQIIGKPFLRKLLVENRMSTEDSSPLTCVIVDGIMGFALDAIDAGEVTGIPIIYFRTVSACSFWSYFCIPQLIQAGELPFIGKDMDESIVNVTGMEGFLRCRDLPSFCRVSDLSGHGFQVLLDETRQTPHAHGLILNTFDDLEGPILSHICTQCPNLYTIGPLHSHLKTRLASIAASTLTNSNSLWEEDKSCIGWLNEQPLKSVVYVSFGSITTLTRKQLIEFWYGLVNSGMRFLWVIRPDSIVGKHGESQIPAELEECMKTRGFMVGWAPQEEVLAHPAIGGFLTHSGWNSTLESIVEGVPMLCWPFFADQQVNSRFASEVWKIGLDMKDTCDRVIVKKMVKDVMEVRRDEFISSADQMAKLARKSIVEGGSSYSNLDRLIDDIRLMCVRSQ